MKTPRLSRHHMIPKSRAGEFPGMDNNHPNNIKMVSNEVHRAWHRMFYNMLPNEAYLAVQFLSHLWKTRDYFIVFNSRSPEDAANLIQNEWTPNVER